MHDWRWTNRSVALMAGDTDPVDAISDKARKLVLDALDKGWRGPPFDPFWLANLCKIEFVAKAGVRDARTVPVGRGQRFRIEFNPTRPAARVRYSVAHEIAHTLFPDCATAVRHRAARSELAGDEWQLEALCNVAAAELLMPLGSFPNLREESMTIERLVELRRTFAVSTEALLIRAVRVHRRTGGGLCRVSHRGGHAQGRLSRRIHDPFALVDGSSSPRNSRVS